MWDARNPRWHLTHAGRALLAGRKAEGKKGDRTEDRPEEQHDAGAKGASDKWRGDGEPEEKGNAGVGGRADSFLNRGSQ